MFQLIFIFRILRSWKGRYSHRSISPTSYLLMRLWWLDVSNRVRNWNKVQIFIFVGSKFQLCQLEIPIFIYKLNWQTSLFTCLISVLWIISCNELKWRQKYYFSTFIISNSKIEILVSFSRLKNVNVNMSFPNSNFEGNLCYASHFDIIVTWKVNVGHRDIYYAKKY